MSSLGEARFAVVDLGLGPVGDLVRSLEEVASADVLDAVARVGDVSAVIVPGKSRLEAGAAQRLGDLPVMDEVARFAADGGAVLAVGSAVEVLCQRGLLRGSLSDDGGFDEGSLHCLVEGRPSPFTWALPVGRCLSMGGGSGQRFCGDDLSALEDDGQVVLRFCASDGGTEPAPGFAHVGSIAGLCTEQGNVVGVLPQLGLGGISLLQSAIAGRAGRSSRIPL